MADPSPDPQAGDDDMAGTDRKPTGGLAGWQKVVGLVGLVVLVTLVILLLLGDHGPGRHVPGGEGEPSAAVVADAGRRGPRPFFVEPVMPGPRACLAWDVEVSEAPT